MHNGLYPFYKTNSSVECPTSSKMLDFLIQYDYNKTH